MGRLSLQQAGNEVRRLCVSRTGGLPREAWMEQARRSKRGEPTRSQVESFYICKK